MSNGLLFDDLHCEPIASPAPPANRTVARARASDPQSSHEAAETIESSGTANIQRQQVIDAVWKWPGRTSKELAALDGTLDRYQFGRRLPEAEELGEIHRRDGGKELTWHPGRKPE